jgi:radical SAM superfamily enzyme YgiQ (UPF0313 family)
LTCLSGSFYNDKKKEFVSPIVILIHPPVSKPSEPPAGIALLSGHLRTAGVPHHLLDANLEGLFYLLRSHPASEDTWTRRAHRHLFRNLKAIKDLGTYTNTSRYTQAVLDVNRLLQKAPAGANGRVSLADYSDSHLSPLKSGDLLRSAEHPESNIFYPYFSRRLHQLFDETEPSIVGLSLNYLSQALCAFAMIGFVRQVFPGTRIVLGGGLVTSWIRTGNWAPSLNSLVDHAVAGPGESLLIGLAGKISTPTHALPCYDALPLDDYLSPGRIIPYSASRGCYWNRCSFCPERAEGNPQAQSTPARVASDLRVMTERLRPALIHLTDNAVSPSLMHSLCQDPPGAPWYGFARVTLHLSDYDFCISLKKSGCAMLKLGLESGSQRILDSMNKGTDLAMMSKTLWTLKKAGIAVYAYLLFGTPLESEKEACETLSFVEEHGPAIGFLNVALFNLPHNSPDTRQVRMRDFYEGDLSLYTDFIHPRGWSRRQVRLFLENEFKRNRAVRTIIKRRLPLFTSNHAPFFVIRD